MNRCVMFRTKEMEVALYRRKYHWSVWAPSRAYVLAAGECYSFNQAFRNARNYIRHHQNEVYTEYMG